MTIIARLSLTSLVFAALCGCVGHKSPSAAQQYAAEKLATSTDLLPAGKEELDKLLAMDPIDRAKFWGKEYDKAPGNTKIALAFARALRAIDSEEKAAEIAAAALSLKPADPELSEIYARAALTRTRPDLAASALLQAEANFGRNWQLFSLLGVALDQTGQHEKARLRYKKALQIAPGKPSVMANLALSHALSGDPTTAEKLLRQAATKPDADTKVRQNLALILGIQGKFQEAEAISSKDLSPQQIRENMQYFRSLLAPKRSWSGLTSPE